MEASEIVVPSPPLPPPHCHIGLRRGVIANEDISIYIHDQNFNEYSLFFSFNNLIFLLFPILRIRPTPMAIASPLVVHFSGHNINS